MAFKLKGNIFNNNTGSPLMNSNKCLEYGIVNGKSVCVKRSKEATREPKQFSKDPEEKAKQLQWIKDNPKKYKEMLGETKTMVSTRDIKSGETSVKYKGKPRNFSPGFAKAYGLVFDSETPTWEEQTAKMQASKRFRMLDRKKRKKVEEAFKNKFLEENPGAILKPIDPSKRTKTTISTPDSVSEWSEYK